MTLTEQHDIITIMNVAPFTWMFTIGSIINHLNIQNGTLSCMRLEEKQLATILLNYIIHVALIYVFYNQSLYEIDI